MSLPGDPVARPDRPRRARWAMRWKPALNAFAITFNGRIVPSSVPSEVMKPIAVRLVCPASTPAAWVIW
jgi:hypothetical protein